MPDAESADTPFLEIAVRHRILQADVKDIKDIPGEYFRYVVNGDGVADIIAVGLQKDQDKLDLVQGIVKDLSIVRPKGAIRWACTALAQKGPNSNATS